MEALVKGSKAPKVRAICSKCGSPFERSAVHPYIVDCLDCRSKERGVKKEEHHKKVEFGRHMKCPDCQKMISGLGKVGMHRCPRCKDQWWSTNDGWWRRIIDDGFFQNGEYIGTLREQTYEEIRKLPPVKMDTSTIKYNS